MRLLLAILLLILPVDAFAESVRFPSVEARAKAFFAKWLHP